MCGRVNAESLKTHPARAISQTPPPEGASWCAVCAKKAHVSLTPTTFKGVEAAWLTHLQLHMRRSYIKARAKSVEQYARRLAELGPPTDTSAYTVYEILRPFLLRPGKARTVRANGTRGQVRTLTHLSPALGALPQTVGALRDLAKVLQSWETITQRNLAQEYCKPEQVISIIQQVPDTDAYIRHLARSGLLPLGAMFHPNTFARAKADPALRGLFAGSHEYWRGTASQLNIVTD